MRKTVLALLLVFASTSLYAQTKNVVIVELFTSEGCSSCPAADRLAAKMQGKEVNGRELVLLAFHVDYWNRLGWKDRFSSAEFTQRQRDYAFLYNLPEVYTPQLLLDGKVVEPFSKELLNNVEAAAAQLRSVTFNLKIEGDTVAVQAEGEGKANLYLAITEDGLTTVVKKGENDGKTLEHSGVIRRFIKLGELKQNKYSGSSKIKWDETWRRDQLRAVVFAQSAKTGQVLGGSVAQFAAPATSSAAAAR